MGIVPEHEEPNEALKVLSDLALSDPNLLAAKWYDRASTTQLRLFRKEWAEMQMEAADREMELEELHDRQG